MNLFSLVVQRPVATWMIAIAAAVFGLVSYERLPLNLMPDLSYPTLTVRTEVTGYAPEEVESQISRPIEEALATTEGLVEIESRSRAGTSDVVLEFAWGTGMDDAAQNVRERLQTTFLPDDARRPLILRYDPSQEPVLRIGLSVDPSHADAPRGEAALYLLRELADREFKRELEAMDGVAAVRARGGLEREIRVEARESWLAARGVTIDQLSATLSTENVNLPGGAIREGEHEYLVRTLNEVSDLAEIRSLQVRRADGVRVPIDQLAVVREAHRDREVISRLDGREAVELEVFKAADANIVRVSQQLQQKLGLTPRDDGTTRGIVSNLPDGVVAVVLENQAHFIEQSINNLRSTAMLGAVLAVLVLFFFLRDFRATSIIAAAIPLSIVVTFAPMYVGGVSLNLMSLGGLALGVGMLVDNAVVVLENIQVHVERGGTRRAAAVDGTKEVAAAVIASTLTTVCVFLPIAFVDGVAGQIFGDLALAVVFSLLASLVVALFFVPMLAASGMALPASRPKLAHVSTAARFHSIPMLRDAWNSQQGWRRAAYLPWWVARFLVRLTFELLSAIFVFPSALLARLFAGIASLVLPRLARAMLWAADRFNQGYGKLAERYGKAMPTVLANPGAVLVLAAFSLLIAWPIGQQLGQALIPELHQGRFTAELALPVGTPLARTADLVADLEDAVGGHDEVLHLHSIIGTERRADSRGDEGEHTARVMVELRPGGNLADREALVIEDVRAAAQSAAATAGIDIDLRITRPTLFSFSTPIEVVLYDNDLDRLRAASDDVRAALTGLSGLTDVRSSMVAGFPEVRLRYDRALLERFGLDTATVAAQVRDKVQGTTPTTISRGDDRVDLVVRLTEEERRSVQSLRRLNVNPQVNPPVPLEAVAKFTEAEGPSEIRRVDQRRAAAISANLDGFDISGQAARIKSTLRDSDLAGVDWEIAGQNLEMERSLTSLQMALALAIFLVYVIMASTFESILHPFVILFSVPLATVGVVGALWLTGIPVSVVVLIGGIVLAGVVVNNAIVLVDTINRKRDAGLDRNAAIAEGAVLRLRPILITTLTTVLGLLPLAVGIGEGAEIQRPLAMTIIAGLSSSTLLTLVVIPVVYMTLTRLLERGDKAGTA